MIKEKKCSNCGIIKPLDCFYKQSKHIDGLRYECKECSKVYGKKYLYTKKGLITSIHAGQTSSSKSRGHNPPSYSNQELKEWLCNQKLFHKLYDNWKASGYLKELRPSCDRTDDYKGYSLDRLQLMTWQQNLDKAYNDCKSGINNKRSKSVIGINKITKASVSFYSIAQVERLLKIPTTNISKCCLGERKSAGGYVWAYKN